MFAISEAEAAAIRTLFEYEGEFAAAIELRRLFPLITDNGKAAEFARIIAGWQPIMPATMPPSPRRAGSDRRLPLRQSGHRHQTNANHVQEIGIPNSAQSGPHSQK